MAWRIAAKTAEMIPHRNGQVALRRKGSMSRISTTRSPKAQRRKSSPDSQATINQSLSG